MSTRLTILQALIKDGQSTYDELELSTGINRAKLRIAVNDAKKAGHVDLKKDIATSQPAYSISKHGRDWVKKNGTPAAAAAQEAREAEQELEKEASAVAKPDQVFLSVAVDASAHTAYLSRIQELEEILDVWRDVARFIGGTTPAEVRNAFAAQDIRLTDQVRKTNEALECQGRLEDQLSEMIEKAAGFVDRIRELENSTPISGEISETDPIGYLVVTPKKLRRFKKESSAQAQAMAHARTKGTAEVFSIYPHAKAMPGAEWKRHA